MFQTFDLQSNPEKGPERLAQLRDEMGDLDAYLVPRSDVYQGEYVAPCDERLAWLTGFTGSAGFCVVLKDRAGVFIDGRYRLQVLDQVADVFTPVHWPETQLAAWIKEQLSAGGKVGFDPWLHTVAEISGLNRALAESGFEIVPTENLIDRIWHDQPSPPDASFIAHPDALAGESSQSKRERLSKGITNGCHIITQPDSIAWLLNIRGRDIERNPVPHAFAVLHPDASVDLFARDGKAGKVIDHLGPEIRIRNETEFVEFLAKLPAPIRLDPKTCPIKIATEITKNGTEILHAQDPCLLPKARKNAVEIEGARKAHLRDATAMVRFLAWLDRDGQSGLTEIDVVQKLESFRRETNQLLDISFETISGAGPNGAIVHYRVTNDTNRPVNSGELLLVDSGGQYADGTTDITRTIAIGPAGNEERRCYTLVLKGMIAVSRLRFPIGVGGQHLDAFARSALWAEGLDYDHGTGHGVGSFLSVHEGPQSLSRRNQIPFEEGMILSNEPGYYRTGAFGIRIENLIVVQQAPKLDGSDDRKMLSFETLTWVPLDRALIDTSLLTAAEHEWLDWYHSEVLAKVGPTVDGADLEWLKRACAPL